MQYWPSSPLQPPEFDMIPPNFPNRTEGEGGKFGRSCQILGVAEDYLALETSQDQSHHAPKLIRTEGKDQFGGIMWLVEWSFKIQSTKRQLSWLFSILHAYPLCKGLLLHVQRKVFEIRKWCLRNDVWVREEYLRSQILLSDSNTTLQLKHHSSNTTFWFQTPFFVRG